MKTEPNYLHLNLGNRWPGFELTNLEIAAEGALQLRAVPRLVGTAAARAGIPIPTAPSGIARTDDGALFFTEPDHHLLWRVDPCDPRKMARPAPCLGGEGSDAGQFKFPRGLLFVPRRGLLVADSGNNRVQIIDPVSFRILEIWNGVDENGDPLLHQPWSLCSDSEGNVYVVVAGDHSIRKLDLFGRIDANFKHNLDGSERLTRPVAAAIAKIAEAEYLLVLDSDQRALLAFTLDGHWRQTFFSEWLEAPLALAVSSRAIYVGDNGENNQRILQFDLPGLDEQQLRFVGYGLGNQGPIAALVLDCHEALKGKCEAEAPEADEPCYLLVSQGSDTPPLVFQEAAGYVSSGVAVAGPFDFRELPVTWHRLQATVEALPAHAHVRFFFHFGESLPLSAQASPPGEPFENWNAFPSDATDALFESHLLRASPIGASNGKCPTVSKKIRIGLKLSGDGSGSPRIHQIRLQFNHESYLPYLPVIYSEEPNSRRFLLALLSLFESFFEEQERALSRLPALFDPYAAPAEHLAWLASWLAQDIKEEWSAERKRRMIANAFRDYARRGTPAGLRRRLIEFAGAQAHIIEPLMNAGLWSLDETSVLDFDTMLAPAEAQGAVLGTTATLDRSHLITNEEFGAPLFGDVAHRFMVGVYPNVAGSPERLEELRAIIERDKPAHTTYQLCVIQPGVSVGFQSLVGIDTIVGGAAPATLLSQSSEGGLVLAGTPPAKLGEGANVGVNTQVY